MKLSVGLLVVLIALSISVSACKQNKVEPTGANNSASSANNASASPAANSAPTPISLKVAGPMPDEAFKAVVSIDDPPTQMRPGQVEIINIKVKNNSNVVWWQRGGETTERTDAVYYVAAGNRWLDKDGKLTTETEGHNGIPKHLQPGEEVEMTLQITAPKTRGEWTMDLDMVQEGVAWFSEKGSPTTKVKVIVK